MSIFQVDIEKFYSGEYWTNVYHINSANPVFPGPVSEAQDILDAERAVHSSIVTFTKMRVSNLSDDTFTSIPINQPGERAIVGQILPLWNVVRVDGTVVGHRPCRKYLRTPIFEDSQTNGALVPSEIDFYNANYCVPLESVTGMCNEHGDLVNSWLTNPNVAMRQLRRGSKRRSQPVI